MDYRTLIRFNPSPDNFQLQYKFISVHCRSPGGEGGETITNTMMMHFLNKQSCSYLVCMHVFVFDKLSLVLLVIAHNLSVFLTENYEQQSEHDVRD